MEGTHVEPNMSIDVKKEVELALEEAKSNHSKNPSKKAEENLMRFFSKIPSQSDKSFAAVPMAVFLWAEKSENNESEKALDGYWNEAFKAAGDVVDKVSKILNERMEKHAFDQLHYPKGDSKRLLQALLDYAGSYHVSFLKKTNKEMEVKHPCKSA